LCLSAAVRRESRGRPDSRLLIREGMSRHIGEGKPEHKARRILQAAILPRTGQETIAQGKGTPVALGRHLRNTDLP